MQSIDRLIRICCFYNKVKFADFYNIFSNPRTKDARSMVYHILHYKENFSIYDISELLNKSKDHIVEMLKHHDSEYQIINHYTRQYENTYTQFKNWKNAELDLAYSIIKTKHDYDLDIKYEQILNENNRLEHQIDILKIKLNKKSYV
tara:strand:- start:310 stop:750 length:441 start_codon:yes stop_codon:yes gene_type:complete